MILKLYVVMRKARPSTQIRPILIYRLSIKSFPDYKHLLQENYVEYKYIFYLF
jgi:hypothetical protein